MPLRKLDAGQKAPEQNVPAQKDKLNCTDCPAALHANTFYPSILCIKPITLHTPCFSLIITAMTYTGEFQCYISILSSTSKKLKVDRRSNLFHLIQWIHFVTLLDSTQI